MAANNLRSQDLLADRDDVTVCHYSGYDINEYYPRVCHDIMEHGAVTFPRGLETKELHPTTVHIYNPRRRILTSHGRMVNLPFALAEVVQILGGLNDAQALKHYNSQIVNIQGDTPDATRFNAAYGERLRNFTVGTRIHAGTPIVVDQLHHVIETLKADPDSRQASYVLSHPGNDYYAVETKDRACNVYGHFMIRNGKLDLMHVIRSNDVVWGLPYNFIQWLHVMDWVAAQLKVGLGNAFIIQDSLHVYAIKYGECKNIESFSMYDYMDTPLFDMFHVGMGWFYENVVQWEGWIRTGGPSTLISDQEESYWYDVVKVFNSYAAFKMKHDLKAFDLMPHHPELRWPLMRNYVSWRWGKGMTEEHVHLSNAVFRELPFSEDDKVRWLKS